MKVATHCKEEPEERRRARVEWNVDRIRDRGVGINGGEVGRSGVLPHGEAGADIESNEGGMSMRLSFNGDAALYGKKDGN